MKKIIAGIIAPCVAFSVLSSPVFAATGLLISPKPQVSDSSDALAKAIIGVKSKVTVPDTLTEFTYRYVENNYTQVPYWNLEWRDEEYNSSITVRADKEGNIFYYNYRNSDDKKASPKFLTEELVDKAKGAISKLCPELINNIVLSDVVFDGVYSETYTYNFVRIENGIKMPDNNISVSLKYDTGDLMSFSSSWVYNLEVPNGETNISKEDAKAKIGENVEMNLEYRNKMEEVDGKKVIKAYLVYVPNKYYVAIDAKTGKIYDSHDEFYSMDEYANSTNMKVQLEGAAADSDAGFTEKEIEKIEEMKGLITKDKALEIITSESSFLIDENAKAVEANLYANYNYITEKEDGYIWRISISDPRKVDYEIKDTYRANINATVDAMSGKILSFRASTPSYYDKDDKEWKDINVKYSNDECRKVLEKFIKKTEPDKFSNTKFSENSGTGYLLKIVNDDRIYGGYTYQYNRYNEGIKYNYNSINGAVDGVTGKIYSYSTRWDDNVEFESPKNAMNKEDAYRAYVNNDGFEFVYEINNKHYIEDNKESSEYYNYDDLYLLEKEVRLVYRTNIDPSYISPFTGKQLNSNGDVYENQDDKEYKDIDGLWANREIRLITDLNITFDGENFFPNKEITEKEFSGMLEKLGYYRYDSKNKEEKDSITKLKAIKIIIGKLNLDKVAELKGIYKTDFNDLASIKDEDIGYVALAKAVGIISGDTDGNLTPNKSLTRAEAVIMALKLVECNLDR